jgi:hypothetical protein
MGERFGKRWIDDYGDIPTKAWADLIDKFSQEDLAEAFARLKDRPEHSRSHPPTHAEFEVLLAKAAKSHEKPSQDFMRGYWRSMVVMGVAGELGHTSSSLEPHVVARRDSLGAQMRALLDQLCDSERRMNQRTEGLHDLCREQCRAIAIDHRDLRQA